MVMFLFTLSTIVPSRVIMELNINTASTDEEMQRLDPIPYQIECGR